MMQKVFGYIRVSSKDQNIDRQLVELQELGIEERDIFIDKQSGKDFDRPNYQALKRYLRKGDMLYIKSIDRFGRNSREIKKEWEEITFQIGADIRVIDMPLLDTTLYKDTMGTFVSELVLQLLAFIAEKERETILQRQKEGIAVAKAKGKHLGRPQLNLETISDEQKKILQDNYRRWKAQEITGVQFMKLLNLKKNTFYKVLKEFENAQNDIMEVS